MCNIIIKVMEGEYTNTDTHNLTLGYISDKAYIGGYGFSPNLPLSIIEQFQSSEHYSNSANTQKMWHFAIMPYKEYNHTTLFQLATEISSLFAPQYQILYALDLIRDGKPCIPHLHFGVNAFSYHPDSLALSPELMRNYITTVKNILTKHFGPIPIILEFQGKRE